jgi:hypothetical protein
MLQWINSGGGQHTQRLINVLSQSSVGADMGAQRGELCSCLVEDGRRDLHVVSDARGRDEQ